MTRASIEQARVRAWCASTIASLVVASLILALFDHGGRALLGVALVALVTIPVATWYALGSCMREASRAELTGAGMVRAHVAVGFAFGALAPAALSLAVAVAFAAAMAQGNVQSVPSVLAFGLLAAMVTALAGFLLSLPVSLAGGVAAVLALRGSTLAARP